MTTAVPVPVRTPGPARVAATLAAGSAVVHVLQVTPGSLGSLLMAAMALACLPCAWHLWRSPTGSVWALTAAVDAGMLLLHATLMADGGTASHHAAHTTVPGSLVWTGLTLVLTQLCLTAVAALRR